jgi:class 3 adenylate cyclase
LTVAAVVSEPAPIVFTDIQDFATLSERIAPQETVSLLNEYFTELVEMVLTHHRIWISILATQL